MDYYEDILFNLNAISVSNRLFYVDQNLYYYVHNNSSLSNVYRVDLWNKLKLLNNEYHKFYSKNNLIEETQERLDNFLTGTVIRSFYNEAHNENRKILSHKLKTLQDIINCRDVRRLDVKISKHKRYYVKLYSLLIRFRMPLGVYVISRIRFIINQIKEKLR